MREKFAQVKFMKKLVVLGLGSRLMTDDAVGISVVENLQSDSCDDAGSYPKLPQK